MRGLILSFALALALAPLAAGEPPIPFPPTLISTAGELRSQALADGTALELVTSLVNEVGARPAGSEGDKKAVAWGLARFKGLGFDQVWSEEVTVPHWVRGTNSGEILAPNRHPLVLTALGGSVATPPGGLEAEVLRVESLADLETRPNDSVAGKIVFIDERMKATRDGSGYGAAVAKRGAGPGAAAKKGAAALLIRSAGTSKHRVAHTGATRYPDGVVKIPAASLANVDADVLAAQIATGQPVQVRLVLDTRVLPDEKSANVIAELRGREKPEEIVVLACHLDSWDLGHGAQDDGAGCATVMAAGRLLGRLPERPRRTVRVVLYANEEFGLSGARAYAQAHAAELPRHVAAAEADLGSGRVWRMHSGVTEDRLPAVRALAELLAPLGIELGPNDGSGGADFIPLKTARVPLFALFQDATAYFEIHHTENDTLAFVDPESLAQNVAAHTIWAFAVAEWEGDWGRAPEGASGR
ncbi:MAG TPA: M28 family peptidase [Thermoanaerobaculia bacterium]|nr:M28 family peptidase [Thermoanaerobaculia bacterium]